MQVPLALLEHFTVSFGISHLNNPLGAGLVELSLWVLCTQCHPDTGFIVGDHSRQSAHVFAVAPFLTSRQDVPT